METCWPQCFSVWNHFLINKKGLITMVCLVCFGLLCIRGQFPKGASYCRRCFSILNLVGLYLEGLIYGRSYFRNFTVYIRGWARTFSTSFDVIHCRSHGAATFKSLLPCKSCPNLKSLPILSSCVQSLHGQFWIKMNG